MMRLQAHFGPWSPAEEHTPTSQVLLPNSAQSRKCEEDTHPPNPQALWGRSLRDPGSRRPFWGGVPAAAGQREDAGAGARTAV